MPSAEENFADEAIAGALEFAAEKLSLDEMIQTVWIEAHRIEGSQRARLVGALISEPDSDQIARAARLRAVMTFLENCRDQPDKAATWLQQRRRGRG